MPKLCANYKDRHFPEGLIEDEVLDMIKPIPNTDGTMKLNQYQKEAITFIQFPDKWTITYPVIGLSSEVGEVCDKVKKAIRDRSSLKVADLYNELKPELGDVLWYVAILAHNLGITLEDLAKHNIEKLTDRKERNAISGSGDNR